MFDIISKEFELVGNKTKCTLRVNFSRNIKLLHRVSLITMKNVEFDFIKKHKNIVNYGFMYRPTFTITSVTTCNSADEFDKEKGRKIAFLKALKKLNKYDVELTQAYVSELCLLLQNFSDFRTRLENNALINCKNLNAYLPFKAIK